jgi:putative addiction module CopG family antidote
MTQVQIQLPDAIGEFAGAQVSSGRFSSVSDYVQALVVADEAVQRTTERLSENQDLAALLEDGLASGEGRPWTPNVLGELKQQVLDRAARPKS